MTTTHQHGTPRTRAILALSAVLFAASITCLAIGTIGATGPDVRVRHLDCQLKDPSILQSRSRAIRPEDCVDDPPAEPPRPWLWFAAALASGTAGAVLLVLHRRRRTRSATAGASP